MQAQPDQFAAMEQHGMPQPQYQQQMGAYPPPQPQQQQYPNQQMFDPNMYNQPQAYGMPMQQQMPGQPVSRHHPETGGVGSERYANHRQQMYAQQPQQSAPYRQQGEEGGEEGGPGYGTG